MASRRLGPSPPKTPTLAGYIFTVERDAVYENALHRIPGPCGSQISGVEAEQLADRQVAFRSKTEGMAQRPGPRPFKFRVPLGYLANLGFLKPQLAVPNAEKREKATTRLSSLLLLDLAFIRA